MFTGKSRLLGKPDTITMRLFLKTQVGRFVIKELVHAFSRATAVMDALKKFSKLPACIYNSIYAR